MTDYASITELPRTLLTTEQWRRILHRYALGMRESGLGERPARVLEVGCGAGIGLAAWDEAARASGGFVAGLEFVEGSLHAARANLGAALPLLCGDAQTLPFADGSFDAIAAFEVIYYLPNLLAFLRESRRVLARGGSLILCWSNPDWATFVPGLHSGHYPTLSEMSGLLAAAGFTSIACYGAFPSSAASQKQKWVNRARQFAARTGLTCILRKFAAPLMRAAYGELTPLPERLALAEIEGFEADVTELDALMRDSVHRVLYVVAA